MNFPGTVPATPCGTRSSEVQDAPDHASDIQGHIQSLEALGHRRWLVAPERPIRIGPGTGPTPEGGSALR